MLMIVSDEEAQAVIGGWISRIDHVSRIGTGVVIERANGHVPGSDVVAAAHIITLLTLFPIVWRRSLPEDPRSALHIVLHPFFPVGPPRRLDCGTLYDIGHNRKPDRFS